MEAPPTLSLYLHRLRKAARSEGIEPEAIEYSAPMWEAQWRSDVERYADGRNEISLPVFRAYAVSLDSIHGALRNLRAASNAEELRARYALRSSMFGQRAEGCPTP